MGDKEGMRGVGVGAAIAAQRTYAAASRGKSKFGLMVPDAFVRGIRDLGYRRNGDAIAELIDNALQAYADRIDISFGYEGTTSAKKPTQVAVIDNGHGMEPAMIRMAVMWGGTHRENDRSGLGRYGYGLPCASVSLGRRFTVYSSILGGGWYSVTLDLDALAEGAYTDDHGDIIVPPAMLGTLPAFVTNQIAHVYPDGLPSGTVILIERLDRLEWSTAQGLRENLCRQFGATYHKLRHEAAIYVDNDFVEPIDPLFLTPDFHLFDHDDDRAVALNPVRVEVHDPEGGSLLGAMTLRYAWLPPSFGSVDKARDAVGLNANPRFTILKDFHGIIFSRHGRLIDVQTRTPWTNFINNDRYIKVEIEFPASLDELFGVTTSKQQVTVSPFIWELLKQAGLPKALEQLRGKVKDAKIARHLATLTTRAEEQRLSERTMRRLAELTNSRQQTLDLELRAFPYRLRFENLPGQASFRVDQGGGTQTLYINSAHRFYEDIYDTPTATQEVRTTLEIMLFSFGDVLLSEPDGRGVERIELWSRRLEQVLSRVTECKAAEEDINVGPHQDSMPASLAAHKLR